MTEKKTNYWKCYLERSMSLNYSKLATLILSHFSINIEHIFWNVALYKTWKLLAIASLNKRILFTIMIGNKRYLAFSWKNMLHSYLFHQLGWAQILESVYNWIFAESTGMNCNFVQLIGHALTYTHKLWESRIGLRSEWVQSYKNVIEHLKCVAVHYFLFIRIIKWK